MSRELGRYHARGLPFLRVGSILGLAAVIGWTGALPKVGSVSPRALAQEKPAKKIVAPELDGGLGWLNTSGPIRLKDLRGKIVLLDFWTYCCINCIHCLPDLAKLEKKYENQLVVIGVHSAKFANEKNTDAIRKAILRYEIAHPVVNDARMEIWDAYGVSAWPSMALIDPEGNLVKGFSGEGNYDRLVAAIDDLIKVHREKKTLNEKPMRFELARASESADRPLFFPGKVLADAKSNRLFIADSTHHRIVVTDLEGNKVAIVGTGKPGKTDGAFDKAQFDDPQGMALDGNRLYVADRKNHLIRLVDLKDNTVKTIAGTGEQDRGSREGGGAALKTGLNSPWDLLLLDRNLYIAMAGHHQLWVMDLTAKKLFPFAGDGGEDIRDGTRPDSRFAQPSGLATDGKTIWVADSEVSAVRAVTLDFQTDEQVKTLVGLGLFKFGDVDGTGDDVRLQHALGVCYVDGKLYVADTYNSKIKLLDPKTRACKTFVGGDKEGWLAGRTFFEPAGLSHANGKLYVADTNAHRIRVVDLKSKAVSTLELKGVDAPK